MFFLADQGLGDYNREVAFAGPGVEEVATGTLPVSPYGRQEVLSLPTFSGGQDMRKTSFTWRHCARASVAILAILWLSGVAPAGTMTLVDLPATGTDAAIGISTTKTYTHAYDFGSYGSGPATINGVALERGPTASLTAAYNGKSRQGYRYTITDTRATVNLPLHAGSDCSSQADGSSRTMLWDMLYHGASTTIGAGLVLILSDLTPGATYSFHYYYRSWGTGATARTITIQADGGHNGKFTDTMDVELDAGGAHRFDYTYTCDDTDVTLRFLTNDNNNGVHLYGFTNELLSGPTAAQYPSPADQATDVYRNAVLSWLAGKSAATHNVYFGTTFADVNTATVAKPLGVLMSTGQTATTFDPGRLVLGQTYYWRVDEVNKAPDFTVFKGSVWSFTVEPVSYAIAGITATASSVSAAATGPEKTIDGSGLNALDQHSTTLEQMWLSAPEATKSAWIQYAFDKLYKLDRMLVWNSNQTMEPFLGFGAKAVTIEYSADASTWNKLGDFEFARATGLPTYTANTTVDFAGATAKFVRLTITSNWGGVVSQYGLSEVRFYQIPVVAGYPSPTSGTTGLAPHVALSWRPGREAGTNDIFLGTDATNLTKVASTVSATYETDLALGQTYYWKVVEVNNAKTPSSWEGPVWSFSTTRFLILDDFETYNDLEGKGTRIYETWIDGYGTTTNGAQVGYLQAPFAETTIFFAGRQSMPFFYDNTSAKVTYSEAVRTFDTAQDWTKYGCKGLSLYFFGDPNNTGQLYVKINNTKVPYSGAASDLKIATWLPWTIDLASTGASLQKVTSLTVGVEGAGAKGKLLFDSIGLYPSAAADVTPADPGTKGLVAYYKLDGDGKDSAGTHNGTANGNPAPWVAGQLGQAFNVTADLTYIGIPYSADFALSTFTVSVWVKASDKTASRGIIGTRIGGEYTFDLKFDATRIHGDVGNGSAWLSTAVDIVTAQGGVITANAWHHILYAVEPGITHMYLDGALASTLTYTGTPMFMKSGEELRIGCDYVSGTSYEYLRGAVDEVRIFNRALSAPEAAFLAGRTGPMFQAP